METLGKGEDFNREISRLLAEKNLHETKALCEKCGVSQKDTNALLTIVRSYGKIDEVLNVIEPLCRSGKTARAFKQLKELYSLLKTCPFADKMRLDFSVVNERKYYNGITFKGFIDGVAEGVLSGGQYDGLMQSMGRTSGAIGFAVYLDTLSSFNRHSKEYDVDVLLLYDEKTPLEKIASETQRLISENKTVRAQSERGTIRAREIFDIKGGKA